MVNNSPFGNYSMSNSIILNQMFVHLRVHSEFSMVDSTIRIPNLIKRTKELQQPAVAITNLANIFDLIKFYKTARKNGIKPIAGSDVWISNKENPEKPYRLLLLIQNYIGYLNLCKLLTHAWLSNQNNYFLLFQ